MSTEHDLRALRRLVRPVVFETGIVGFAVSTAGTAFLLTSRAKTFVLTAKHVVGTYPPQRLRVYQADHAKTPLRIAEFYRINAGAPGDEVEGLLVVEVDGIRRRNPSKPSTTISIDTEADAWHELRHTARYFLIGYPEPKSYVDYEASVIHSGQVLLAGRYLGPSAASPYCHELAVANPLSLSTFSGFSGGPVFSLEERIAMPPMLRFCGLALQGTTSSGVVRFLDCTVLHAAMEEIHKPPHMRRAHVEA